MKKGPLHFLGRKNPSLFDTSVKMKEMDNLELVLQPSAIPESGTASVRARPTVKHLTSSSLDSFQGFAVPTPKVPLLSHVKETRINGSDHLSNGSVLSVLDDHKEERCIPPPPTMAPPPPPGTFIPPPPEFISGLNQQNLRNLQPPRMPAPKPPSAFPAAEGEDFSILQPPQMAPPRPPSICSSGSASTLSASSLPPDLVPEHPKYAAPQPPSERQPKMKTPPLKPIRLSSISTSDSPPQTPAPPPPVQKPTPSTFNPQNTAKVYNIPKTSILSRVEDRSPKPKQLLLLEDSGSANSTPVLVQVDGRPPEVAPKAKPLSGEEKKPNLNISQATPSAAPEINEEIKSEPAGSERPLHTQQQLQEVTNTPLSSSMHQPQESPSQSGKFSPLLVHKLRNLKGSESGASREAPTASPLALLMAAKERDKHRSGQNPQANSFAVKLRSGSSFLTSKSFREESPESAAALENVQTPRITQQGRPAVATDHTHSSSINGMAEPSSAARQQPTPEAEHRDGKEELSMPLLPPPPEFGDAGGLVEPPPDLPPPDPPRKQAQPPRPSLKPKPPQAPQSPPAQTRVKSKALLEPELAQSPSQATLLSILQKKMLEMDRKIAPAKDAEAGPDDWNAPLSEEDTDVPVVPKATWPSRKNPEPDLQELGGKASTSVIRNGPSSTHQYGCTFTVRPGSKQPITVVNKGTS